MSAFEIFLTATFWAAVLRIATPLIFGTMGELICERAGVLNLGIEGIMTFGAMIGWLTVYEGGSLWQGLFVSAAAGALFGLLHGVLTVPLGLSQHVTGLGVTLLAANLSYYIYRLVLPTSSTPPHHCSVPTAGQPRAFRSPVSRTGFLHANAADLCRARSVAVIAYVLYRTPLGFALRMVGESAEGAEAQGINVTRMRIGAVMVGSALMGIGGAFLTLAAFNSFFFTMVQGRGWVCIALVVFGSWRPGKALVGALLYGVFDAYQLRLQTMFGQVVPYQLFLTIPYALSILALAVMSRRATVPQALMVPFRKGER